MFTKVASLAAIGLGLGLLALISMVYLSIEALGTTMEEVTDTLATSIHTGSGAIATGMDLMPVRGTTDLPKTDGETALETPALQVEEPPGNQMQQGNQPIPGQAGNIQPEPDGGGPGQTPIAHRPIPELPGTKQKTGQTLRYTINKMDDNHIEALKEAGALTKPPAEDRDGVEVKQLITDSDPGSWKVFFAPAEAKDQIKTWFTNVQTVSKEDHILLYQEWNNRDQPLIENIPQNYRLEYRTLEGPDPTASYSQNQLDSHNNQFPLPFPFPYHTSGLIRFGEINPEICALAIENSESIETQIDCLDNLDFYLFHFPITSHDHIVAWHHAAEFVADRDSSFLWRLLPQYSQTTWQKDADGDHQLLKYYDEQGNTLNPSQFNLEEPHNRCLCLEASQHGEVVEWFAAQKSLQDGPTHLYWAPIWEID